ncbi:MAG: N-acyl-L-homoserine lactone synthetase [Pseudopelagicola sp.]|nr:N-acyl-L-homoserine lactone synthetase [Pseudopelagicola sp.]
MRRGENTNKLHEGKARMVFPALVPQEDLDRPSATGLRKNLLNIYGYRGRLSQKTAPDADAAKGLNATTTILSMTNMHRYGDLFVKYLAARRQVFIVEKGWQLPETDGMEFDQYDTPLARWIVVHDNGKILGGARISPTTAVCGNHSYMLRDAQLGYLKGLPPDLLYEEAPVRPDIWEATRLFVIDSVPARQRAKINAELMKGMATAARSVGATGLIGIVPAIFKRWLKRIGMDANSVGPVKVIDGDRVQAAIMNVSSPSA